MGQAFHEAADLVVQLQIHGHTETAIESLGKMMH